MRIKNEIGTNLKFEVPGTTIKGEVKDGETITVELASGKWRVVFIQAPDYKFNCWPAINASNITLTMNPRGAKDERSEA